MTTMRRWVAWVAPLFFVLCVHCNEESRHGGSGDGGLTQDGAAPNSCPAGSHNINCPCDHVGDVVGCCQGGMQTCTQVGEFSVWGPCRGADGTSIHCSSDCSSTELANCDGGVPVDMAKQSQCTCVPGAVRWCDEPNYCTWGKQTCGPDGQWGQCIEAGAQPDGCGGFLNAFYDQDCCVQAGQCCQDMANQTAAVSLGNCPGVYVCQ